VAWLTWALGELPWIALTVACSFSAYGLIRKRVPVDGLVGLTVETILLLPLALAYLGVAQVQGAGGWTHVDGGLAARLALSGVVTAVPLVCFGQAARRLPLSSLGFLQYVSPTVQLLLAVFLFGERLAGGSLLGFGLIWAALAIFSIDSYVWFRQCEAVEEVVDRSPPATTERCIAAES
jgi:chloramphenicol-sensitive protein RarD